MCDSVCSNASKVSVITLYNLLNAVPTNNSLLSSDSERDVIAPSNYTSEISYHFVSEPFNLFNFPSPLPINRLLSLIAKLKTPLFEI